MLPDTGIDDVKKQRNAEYAEHINEPVLSSLKMEGIRLLFFLFFWPVRWKLSRSGGNQLMYDFNQDGLCLSQDIHVTVRKESEC
jgi:hypothetical protein